MRSLERKKTVHSGTCPPAQRWVDSQKTGRPIRTPGNWGPRVHSTNCECRDRTNKRKDQHHDRSVGDRTSFPGYLRLTSTSPISNLRAGEPRKSLVEGGMRTLP